MEETHDHVGRTRRSTWRAAFWGIGAVMLLSALGAKAFIGEGGWVDTFAQVGSLLIATGITLELIARTMARSAYRTALGLAVATALMLGWANGAVGILGSEDNRANLLYFGVLLVGIVGAALARLQPRGMARALFVTALAQALIATMALTGLLGPSSGTTVEVVTINGAFVALFTGSALLFVRAARRPRDCATSPA